MAKKKTGKSGVLSEEKKREIARKRRINKEIRRLEKIFENQPEDIKAIADGLIKQAAYQRIQLEDYIVDLEQNGYVELFTQSPKTPPYERERPVVRLYATANRNYQTIMKQLADLLPKQEQKKVMAEDDGFSQFVQAKKVRE